MTERFSKFSQREKEKSKTLSVLAVARRARVAREGSSKTKKKMFSLQLTSPS
jgi:hypothetical protein